jgi:thioredoxin 1
MTIIYILVGIIALFFMLQYFMIWKMKRQKGKPAPRVNGQGGKAIQSGHKTLFYFFSPSCRACGTMTPVVDNLQKKHRNIFKIDISKDMATAKKFGIMGTPSVVMIEGGTIQEFLIGPQPESKLTRWF